MKNSWLVWLFIIGIVVVVFVAFNFHGGKDSVPLSEIFPADKTYPVDLEYEFVDKSKDEQGISNVVKKEESPAVVAKIDKGEAVKEKASNPIVEKKKEVTAQAAPSQSTVSLKENIPFTIQVASFSDKNKAEIKLGEFKKEGYPAFIVSRDLGVKGIWYRVYIGKFNKVEDAGKLLAELKKKYPNSFIISPK